MLVENPIQLRADQAFNASSKEPSPELLSWCAYGTHHSAVEMPLE